MILYYDDGKMLYYDIHDLFIISKQVSLNYDVMKSMMMNMRWIWWWIWENYGDEYVYDYDTYDIIIMTCL